MYDVEFMNVVVDKADDLRVVDCDSHFCKFSGVHKSKINQGKLFLYDVIEPVCRQEIANILLKKDSPYLYFDAEFVNKSGEEVYIHCTGQSDKDSSLCRLTLADLSKSKEKQEKLKNTAKEMNYLIDLVTGGVCLFKVTSDMHIEALYLNEGACKMFGTTKSTYKLHTHRIDELIYPEDKSLVFQAIGKAMATDGKIDLEFRTIVHKNEFIWCKFNAAIQKYDEDNTPIFHAMFTDITKIKAAEEEADRLKNSLILTFKNLPNPIFTTSADDVLKIAIASEDFIKFLGFSRSYIFEDNGGRLDAFISDREVKYVESTIKKGLSEGKKLITVEYSIRTKSGTYIVVEDRRKVIKEDGKQMSMICSYTDVTSTYVKQ